MNNMHQCYRIEPFALRAKKALVLSHNNSLVLFVKLQQHFSDVLVPRFLTLLKIIEAPKDCIC